jgi:RNA polymerase sigma-32 factor
MSERTPRTRRTTPEKGIASPVSGEVPGEVPREVIDGELIEDPVGDESGSELDPAEVIGSATDGGDLGLPDEFAEGDGEGHEPDTSATPLASEAHALEPAGGRSLARLDPLTVYINDIKRYPLLTREDEHELAVKYLNTGDLEAARRLVTANLRLVVKIAHEYRRAHRNLLDLVQEGNVGLVQAVKKYDPYRGVKLSSYAAWWIRAYMLKFILANWRLVKIGTTQAQRKLFFNLRKEKDKLQKLGFDASPKAIADALNVPEQEVIEMEKRLEAGDMSLDAPVTAGDEGGRSRIDMLESGDEGRPDTMTEGTEFRELLRAKFTAFAETLKGREQTIFRERLMTDAPKTLQEIGEHYGISRERARQLEKRLMAKLKTYLRAELGDAVQIAMGPEE